MNAKVSEIYQNLNEEVTRAKGLVTEDQRISWPASVHDQILDLHYNHKQSVNVICKSLELPFTSVYNWVKRKPKSFNKPKFKEVKLTTQSLSTIKTVDKTSAVINFEKNGIQFEIKNLSSSELFKFIGLD